MNKNDGDGGILFGNWSSNDDDYKDGTDPTAWSGSSAILEEYMRTKMPVKYAQCWVFGGTLTTGRCVWWGVGGWSVFVCVCGGGDRLKMILMSVMLSTARNIGSQTDATWL